ncbi:hypothetical protein ACFWJ5_41325 [Streptomyces qaidamensis]|uniref:hypothetical protein n=1 Tax=Streptomyces qaidamensis TaxID=1783515 RepID=UPI003666948D
MVSLCIPGGEARDITLGDLPRHTSGIADHQDLLEAEGIELTCPAGRLLDSWTE